MSTITREEFADKIQEILDQGQTLIDKMNAINAFLNSTNDWGQYDKLGQAIYEFIEDIEGNKKDAHHLEDEQIEEE